MTDPVHSDFLPAVLHLVRGIRKRFNVRAAAHDMTYARAQALVGIAGNEGQSQADLAERLDIRTPSMNRTLDHLEQQGLIERRADPRDKRVRRLFLTPAAHERADRITHFTDDLRREVYQGIPPEDLKQALDVLRRIQRNLDRMD